MLSALFLAVAAPAIATAVNVPNVPVSDNTPDGMVVFPLKVSTGGPVVKGITKRQNEVLLESQQNGFFYSIDVTLGTPGDKVTVNLDTGSAELWVNPVCEKAQQPQFCANFGHFGESSTFVDLNTTGGVVYGTGYAYWNYGYDHVVIGSASIRNQVFGVAYDSSFTGVGIMGAGPDLNGWDAPYPLVIDSMVKQNLIKSRVLSLDIRTLDSERGAVIFGGIDTKKYTGRLQKLPIIPAADSPDGLTRYWVNLDAISLKQEDGSTDAVFSGGSQPVLLDSGYTVSALPGAIFNKIVDNFPTAQRNGGAYVDVDCSVADIKGTVDFTFAGKTIKVPYADFIWHNEERCVLGVFQDDEFPVLGDTFLRAAYVVYDWDNREVWLANNEDCGTNLVAVGTGPNAVPDLEGECGSDETSTSAIETATSTEMETVTATTDVTESVPSDTTTAYFSTTRYSNTTVTWTNKVISSSKPTGGDYDLPPNYTKGASSDYDVPSYTKSGSGDHYSKPSYTDSDSAPSTTVTSTVVTSKVYTVTACPPSVTNCPVGHVTTETITSLTTFCPGADGSPTDKAVAPRPTNGPLTSYVTATNVHTITSCSGKDACDTSVVTEIVHNTQGGGAEPTGVFTIPEAIQCGNGNFGCKEATTKGYRTITVTNVVKAPKPTPVPGYCSTCGPLGEGFTKVPGGHHTGDSNQPGGHHTGGSSKPTGAHPTNAYPRPTGEAPKPDSPEHGDESPKPDSPEHGDESPKPKPDSPHSGGDGPKPNPLEELHTYRPTNVYPIIPTSNIATVVKPTGTPQPEAPTGTPVAISGASSWNVPVVAAVVLGAVVAVL